MSIKTVNPLLTRLVVKALKPRDQVFDAMRKRTGGAGAHRKKHGALRRAEHVAVQRAIDEMKYGED
jgi:hypothetical protein